MIVSCETYKALNPSSKLENSVLSLKLEALELLVRKFTNNNFQVRNVRMKSYVTDGKLTLDSSIFKVGDTIQISQSLFNDGVYTIVENNEKTTLDKVLIDENEVLVTLVKYPTDIVMGVVNLMKWDENNREKVGVSSETISRHSVTYFNMDGDNSIMGYPKSLMGFLKPYMKARF